MSENAAPTAPEMLALPWPPTSDTFIDEQKAAPGVDLVVVGARGLGFLGRTVLGSVSDRVVHHAPCSVLVVEGRT